MGVDWSLREGYAWAEDKEHCEEYGRMLQADPNKVSARAKKRGLPQVTHASEEGMAIVFNSCFCWQTEFCLCGKCMSLGFFTVYQNKHKFVCLCIILTLLKSSQQPANVHKIKQDTVN